MQNSDSSRTDYWKYPVHCFKNIKILANKAEFDNAIATYGFGSDCIDISFINANRN